MTKKKTVHDIINPAKENPASASTGFTATIVRQGDRFSNATVLCMMFCAALAGVAGGYCLPHELKTPPPARECKADPAVLRGMDRIERSQVEIVKHFDAKEKTVHVAPSEKVLEWLSANNTWLQAIHRRQANTAGENKAEDLSKPGAKQ